MRVSSVRVLLPSPPKHLSSLHTSSEQSPFACVWLARAARLFVARRLTLDSRKSKRGVASARVATAGGAPASGSIMHIRPLVFAVVAASLVPTARADRETPTPRSPNRALTLSAIGTVASLTVIGLGFAEAWGAPPAHNETLGYGIAGIGVAGLAITPGVGHVYGERRFWTKGAIVRASSLAIGLGAVLAYLPNRDDLGAAYGAAFVGALALGGMVVGSAMDLATARSATQRYNDHHLSLTVAPTVIRTANNSTVGGIGIVGGF